MTLLVLATATMNPALAPAQGTDIFDPDAQYSVLTSYGRTTQVTLAEYLLAAATGVTFTLKSCDSSRADYYQTAEVASGILTLTSNTLGHVHGSNTQTATVCTVTGTMGTTTEDRDFSLYTVSARTPPPMALSFVAARQTEVDIQVTVTASEYLRLAWRTGGGSVTSRVVSGVSAGSILTIPELTAATEYEIFANLMTRQSFDLYRAGNSGADLTLIAEGSPAAKWRSNLASNGLGKSTRLTATTADATLPTMSINDVTVVETAGAEAAFTVTLSGTSSQPVTVNYQTSDGSAVAGLDYTTTSGTLTIPANTLTDTIRVPVLNDDLDELDETLTVTLSSPANAEISDARASARSPTMRPHRL